MPVNDILLQRTQGAARFLNAYRIVLYCLVSIVAVSAVIANALKNYSNFYSVAIYLSKSSRSVLVLANFGFLLALLCGHIVQKIFFGSLRPNEVERLYDRLWFFITESLLAFTIFRDEFDTPFALMFGFLLFVKSFHWLAGDRIEWMDQRPYPGPSLIFHVRMTVLFVILWTTDFLMFLFAVESTITNGVGGMVLFASEYGILMASVMNTILKYLLSAYEFRRAGRRGGENAPPWENKSMWVFYIELTTDFLKLTTYLVFFIIIITFYGLPLNIIRDVYITARSFITRLRALHRYQTATRNMDQRYPNATEEELTAMSDRTCIICREEMVLQTAQLAPPAADGPNTTPKKLPCGHVFHFYCLRSWLERQQSCPTCRRTVLDNTPDQRPPPAGTQGPPQGQGPAAQQQNPLGAPRVPNAAAGNNLGNPLGLIGRLFGPPGQAVNAGGFPAAQQRPNHAQPAQGNAGATVPPGGILIQYHVQYQWPRQPQSATQNSQQPQPLQPVPRYPGFPGPDGVWRSWPADDRNRDNNPPGSEAQSINTSDPQSIPTDTEQTNPWGMSEASIPTSANTSTEPSSNPREAAAQAALRRLNSGRSVGGTPTTSSAAEPQREVRSAVTTENLGINVPPLIPLYDYGALTQGSPFPRDTIVSYAPNIRRGESSSINNNVSSSDSSSSGQTQSSRPHANVTSPISQSSALHTTLSQLPATLTEEQLSVMDDLTREAIDERLRVLEDVSGALYRCIDNLMRMRSTLPTSTTATFPPVSDTTTPPNATSHEELDEEKLSARKRSKMPENPLSPGPSHVNATGSEQDVDHTA
uniref:RING-type E3 ubiquitin transferase n=1 Tax=Crucibulum laeve TaxID=68775 RepID=A0A5C3MT73_9AGAR|nr:hypothetical protein BDQ12DRAFT_641326 [Crucibulum laeve]